jgi:hypothetical protein
VTELVLHINVDITDVSLTGIQDFFKAFPNTSNLFLHVQKPATDASYVALVAMTGSIRELAALKNSG